MTEFLASSALFAVALTFFAYELGRLCQQKLRLPIFNPILIAAVLTAVVLAAAGIPNETYQSHCEAFSWLLTPATVCLAIPLHAQFRRLRYDLPAILAGVVAGTLTSLGCVWGLAVLFRLDSVLTLSLLPKSITTAMGIAVSEAAGGAPALTTGLETVEGSSGDLTGLATLTCAQASSSFRILAGSGTTGSNSQLLLSNPGDAAVQAKVTVMTPSGESAEPTELSIRAGQQRAVRLGGLAGGAESLAVDVTVDGGVLAGSVQESVLDGLKPQGIDLAAGGASASRQQVLTGLSGKDARVRVANPSSDLAEVSLKAYGPDGEIDIPRSSMTVVGRGVAEAELGDLEDVSLVIDSDQRIQAGGFIGQDGEDGASDFGSIKTTDSLAETQLMALPRTGSSSLQLSPGQGQVQVQGMLDDGSLTDGQVVDLNPTGTTVLDPAEVSDEPVRALVIKGAQASGSQADGVHATLVVTTDDGISTVAPAPAPAGVAYRDIRLG